MNTVLAAIDFSAVTTSVVAAALALARRIHGRVIVLHVTAADSLLRDYAALETLFQAFERRSEGRAGRRGRAQLREDSLQILGEPAHVILQQATRCRAAYIVLGAGGQWAESDSLGRIAARVVQDAPCPVVLVRPLRAVDARMRAKPPSHRRHRARRPRRSARAEADGRRAGRQGRHPVTGAR